MSTSQTLTPLDCGGGERLSMVKAVKMELLRALVSERLSAAAEEIFELVERTIIEYEKEMSCSKWVVDSHRRLLDDAKSHSEDSFQMCASGVKLSSGQQQQRAASVCWAEPETTASEPTEDCPNMDSTHPDPSPASENDQSGQGILIDIGDDDVKQECDVNMPLDIVKMEKRPVCVSVFSSEKTTVQHIKNHPEDNLSLYQCQFCDLYFCHMSKFIIHSRTHNGAKPYTCHHCEKSFGERHSLLIHRQKHIEEKPYLGFIQKVEAETDLRSVTHASGMEELACRQEDSGINIFPCTVTPYDKSEFDQESLQPLSLYQIQTVADIDKDSSAAATVDPIKAEPAGTDVGVSDGAMYDQLLLSVSPSEQGDGKTEPKHRNINNILQSRPSRKSAELNVPFEAGTTQKPHKCPCCTKCFSSTKTLLRHVRTHTEDKAYQCHLCGRNFCQKSDLVNHTRIHTGERPYQCPECPKSFAQKGNLVVHMRKHARDKLYQGQEPSWSCSQRSSFDCQMQSHR
ncbi:zinc finger protein 182 [Etheostoma spectabile]|uniref:zinc finger protein 182 n=1 Tax=Etheostoma spectabile TaxID=54343 RepID=UPI0013AF753A|nr:zinc finger protein 182-like [Etheostoma spectabile]XP_032358767.1 zinc finger protein 182-like [Etheostoma spectabile]XP_032358768.1 zinc finger protein 182-like [Etheostoma spectabile]XP_032358769.1 zinc finger protein 182-like [Etheostoma spectabile]